MKKFLSLALALIMALSLVTVSAGAVTFTDAEEITQTEAVEVMAALGILEGSNGAFNPQGTLTRGAAAKIITYMLEGTAMAEAIKAAGVETSSFADVPTTSSNVAFIEYCARKGIVSGYSNGNFGRKDTLSSQAFLKMVLVALGETEIDFTTKTNPGWPIQATAKALEMEIIDEDTAIGIDAITREEACKIAFAAMQYVPEGNKYWYVGDVKFESATDAAVYAALTPSTTDAPEQRADLTKSLVGKNYKLACDTIIISSNQATVVGQKVTKATGTTGGKSFSVETGLDLIGHKVNVWYKDANANGAYDAKEEVYTVVDLSKVVTVASQKTKQTTEQVEALLGIEIETDGAIASTLLVSNYVVTGTPTTKITYASEKYTVAAGDYIICDEAVLAYKTETSYVDTFTVTLTDAEKGEYNVKDGSAADVVVVDEDEELCKDYDLSNIDWAAMVDEDDTTNVAVYVVTKIGNGYSLAEVQTVVGKVTKTETSNIYVDGTKYGKSAETLTAEITALEATAIATAPNFEDEYVFFLDQAGKVFAYDSTEEGATASDPSLIIPVYIYEKKETVKAAYNEYGQQTNEGKTGDFYSVFVQAYDAAGNEVILQLTDKTASSQLAAKETEINENVFYTYTTTPNEDDVAIATLTMVKWASTNTDKVGQNIVGAGKAPAKTAKKITLGTDINYYLNDSYKVIYLAGQGSKVEVQIVDGTYDLIVEGAMVYGEKADDKDTTSSNYEIKYVLINDTVDTTVAGEAMIFVTDTLKDTTKVPYTDKNGDIQTGLENTAYINGEKVTILTKTTQSSVVTGAGFYTYEIDEEGLYTLKALTVEEAKKVIVGDSIDSIYKGLITIDGKITDMDVTGVKMVNLVKSDDADYSKIATDPTKLTAKETISIALSSDGKSIALIYITDYTA